MQIYQELVGASSCLRRQSKPHKYVTSNVSCGFLSLGISYAMLMRPNKAEIAAVHGC